MMEDIKEILISGVFIFAAGFIVWPPYSRYNYWGLIFEGAGDSSIIVVLALATLVGVGFKNITNFKLSNFIMASAPVYIVSMILIEEILDPISPVHFIGYGLILISFIVGVATSDSLLSSLPRLRS